MKSLKNDVSKFVDAKKTYDAQYRKLADDLHKMPISSINKFLSGIRCGYSYDKNAYFQIEEGEEKNSNCTFDTFYEFKCRNCSTSDRCYLHWKNRKTYSKQSIIKFIEDMFEK